MYCLDRRDRPNDEFYHVADKCAADYGGSLNYAQVDVTHAAALDERIGGIAERYGRLDGLVAAAGVQR